jgi:hypothetical protein
MRIDGPQPFATLESALAFMHLLNEAIADTVSDVQRDVADAQSGPDTRRLEALQLVDYKLQQLGLHVGKSERLLKDLARLRDLVLDGRGARMKTHAAAAD